MRRSTATWSVGAVYLLGLLLVVLTPIGRLLNRITVQMYVVWKYDLRLPGDVLPEDFGFALNVLLFVPLGALLALLTRRPWWLVTLLCVLASTAVELVQALPVIGRYPSAADVLANGLGGLVGALIARGFVAGAARDEHRADEG